MVAACWLLFAPDSQVDPALKNPQGIAAGLIAMGTCFYFRASHCFPANDGLAAGCRPALRNVN